MSCSEFELKDYVLRELPEPKRAAIESHVRECEPCRVELDRLLLTEAALYSVRDEEVPQRIAFVSDQVFEPSPVRRWLSAFWSSAPKLGFASAAMISAAILYSAMTRPLPVQPSPARALLAQSAAPSQPDVQNLIRAAVDEAVRESEARQARKAEQTFARLTRQAEEDKKALALAREMTRYWERRDGALSMETAGYRVRGAQE